MTLQEAFQQAQAYWQAGQAAQAEQLCRLILANVPGQPDALHLLGFIAHAYGHIDEAIQLLRQACASPQATPMYWSNFAEFCRQKGLLQEGETAARRAVTLDPQLLVAWNNLGILLQEMGQYEESRVCLEKVRAADPKNPVVLNNLANTYHHQGNIAREEQLLREAIAQEPKHVEPYNTLTKLLMDKGDLASALQYGRKAIDINPRSDDAYINFSATLKELGRLNEAEEACQTAIAINPRSPNAYINLSAVEKERRNIAAALRWIEALLAFAPQHAVGLAAKASLLLEQGQPEEALEQARKAVTYAPESAQAYYALGQAYQALDQGEAALEAFARSADLPGVKAEETAIAVAVLHMEQGRKSEANAAFLQITERFPRSVSAWYMWADIHRFRPEDPQLLQMEALLADPSTLPKEQIRLHFALGKAWMDAGDTEKAFAHLHAGNHQKRQTFAYDPGENTQLVERICRIITAERIQSLWGQGYKLPEGDPGQPVFVVGLPRSGTTLVERILAAHSAVTGAGELSALQQILSGEHYPENLQSASPEQLHAWGAAYLQKTARLSPKTRYLVDKMPANFFCAGMIPLMLPQAKIIWVRRDLVDTGLSCYTKLFSGEQKFSYQLDEIGAYARDARTLMEHWLQVLPESHFMVVDYEALVEDFDAQVRRMLDFLDLDWEPACEHFYTTSGSVRTASVNQVREPLYRRAVGRWKPYAEHLQPLLKVLEIGDR